MPAESVSAKSRQNFDQQISNVLGAFGLRGVNGPNELEAALQMLKLTAPQHAPGIAFTTGAQASRLIQ